MASHPIHSWTFSSLVGAFLDLSLAYLLLCGSTLVFITCKFLSIFGLYLPCPCNGFFFNDRTKCVNRFLTDAPSGKISSVHMSVISKFPFDSILMKDQQGRQLNLKLVRDHNRDRFDGSGFVELDSGGGGGEYGDGSCSSVSDARAPIRSEVVGLLNSSENGLVKGKTVLNQKTRVIRRRKRASAVEHSQFSSVSDNLQQSSKRDVSPSNYGGDQTRRRVFSDDDDIEEENQVAVNPAINASQEVKEVPADINSNQGVQSGFQMTESLDEDKNTEKGASSAGESVYDVKRELGLDGNDAHSVRILENALEEEHAARIALYRELEEERSAAASAADEAMAMILRLQEEKASIEMEARQYQRMIEEKHAYDAEEMTILKEILVRREREKHFLEKEVEAYRKNMGLRNEHSEGDLLSMEDMIGEGHASFNSSEDPMLMLLKLSESMSNKETVDNVDKSVEFDVKKQDPVFAVGERLPSSDSLEDGDSLRRVNIQRALDAEKQHRVVSECMDELEQKLLEKRIVSSDKQPSAPQHPGLALEAGCRSEKSFEEVHGPDLHEKTIILLDEDEKRKDNCSLFQGVASETGQMRSDTEISFPFDVTDLKKQGKDTDHGVRDLSFESVYDVHVIDDDSKTNNQEFSTSSFPLHTSGFRSHDRPSASSAEAHPDIHRSYSDITNVLLPVDKSVGKDIHFDLLKRSSTSGVDSERMKLETEVERLRERLRVVQEGREKLHISVEPREREQIQLQLLEDIASQLREIRQLNEPGKAARQASLPPPSAKVGSKKRRCRSGAHWGIHGSS
ncbi:uncharacterized protein LOC113296778 isoform X1 [Papaver somniferum]|uniref:uncharacterized protein LOC113296778 isoform X1 n=1 Tax=Papaver somniferum TaxID=3469 RepID=UPI000E7019BD|nr:uncharacterized protein LOC113296778 isoform X1 [Papaver somniferum]XP_026400896.1 uncharacterized protein LOC113296778 isoform X1 [Papaver somniferum]